MSGTTYLTRYGSKSSVVTIDFTTPSPSRTTRISSSYSTTQDIARTCTPCQPSKGERTGVRLGTDDGIDSDDEEEEGYVLKSWGENSHAGYLPGRNDALTPPIDYNAKSGVSPKPTERSIVIKRPMPRYALRASTLKSRIWVDPSFEELLENLKRTANRQRTPTSVNGSLTVTPAKSSKVTVPDQSSQAHIHSPKPLWPSSEVLGA